jgi:hypothetical protein
MIERIREYFRRRRCQGKIIDARPPAIVVMTDSCQRAIVACLDDSTMRKHEGVCLLLGTTDGTAAVCLLAVRPQAETTYGSFHIPAREMARVVDIATDLRLQIIGQVHTHPKGAFHSDGDEDGANIRYAGFVSIVVPNYGASLPDFAGSAVYVFSAAGEWEHLQVNAIHIVPDLILR